MWAPSFKLLNSTGSICTPPASVPENANIIDVDLVLPPLAIEVRLISTAEFIEAIGGFVSTVHLNNAGEGSLFVELSSDTTRNVWTPSVRPLTPRGLVQVTKSELFILHSK